ncbi:MAG: histidinol-phosphatase [Clostridia bacterium]|nr:histidinol-phosphatase [Clostridia bacterium]
MSILSCAHTHTQFCDGRTSAEEMAKIAYDHGFVSLGFSSHAPQDFDPSYVMPIENEVPYRQEVQRLQKEYAGRMTIYLGLERDYFANPTTLPYDYIIGSVHYLPFEDGYVAVDGKAPFIREYIEKSCGGDGMLLARRYYAQMRDYVTSFHPAIIGHLDLLRINNSRLHFLDEESKAYQALCLETLEAIAHQGALLEVNTGAVARGYLTTPYPAAFMLPAWRKLGGEVIVNSDCHFGSLLTAGYDQAEQLLREAGYDHAVRLGRDQLWERFEI